MLFSEQKSLTAQTEEMLEVFRHHALRREQERLDNMKAAYEFLEQSRVAAIETIELTFKTLQDAAKDALEVQNDLIKRMEKETPQPKEQTNV